MKIDEPAVKVNSVKNHNLIFGLVPLTTGYDAKKYVGDKTDYITQYQHTFVDGLLEAITFGIYNPTTTTFYVPLKDAGK
ncbi:Bor family protein [Arcticibacter sp. MXS-1]|uniref:Bor family protein n=1 Tax=Arcticibacter sp. MXS-1 TaxID=3341726 RepID=UPI0035A91EC4